MAQQTAALPSPPSDPISAPSSKATTTCLPIPAPPSAAAYALTGQTTPGTCLKTPEGAGSMAACVGTSEFGTEGAKTGVKMADGDFGGGGGVGKGGAKIGSGPPVKGGASSGKGDGAPAGGGEGGEAGGAAAAAAAAAATAAAALTTTTASAERYQWMPSLRRSSPSRECIRRVRNDIRSLMKDPVPGLFVCPDEELVTVVHALVTGPFDTPYEGGFFYFVLHCPDDYPHNPPRVRLLTTGGGAVRFNPNLYANGKVCLSILGTWNGPRWTPVQSISSVLLSIQSLMSEKPYHNEPGFEEASNPQDVRDYNDCITHETLRVAVCSMVEDSSLWRSMPECFRGLTRDLFLSFVPRYELVCEQNLHRDGEKMADPFGQNKGTFRFGAIQRTIKRLASVLEAAAGGEEEMGGGDEDMGTGSAENVGTSAATAGGGGGGARADCDESMAVDGNVKDSSVRPMEEDCSEEASGDGGYSVGSAAAGGGGSGSGVSNLNR